jgi:hypothetical protein
VSTGSTFRGTTFLAGLRLDSVSLSSLFFFIYSTPCFSISKVTHTVFVSHSFCSLVIMSPLLRYLLHSMLLVLEFKRAVLKHKVRFHK